MIIKGIFMELMQNERVNTYVTYSTQVYLAFDLLLIINNS